MEEEKPKKFHELRAEVDPLIYDQWDREQKYVKKLIIEDDSFEWNLNPKSPQCLKYIGGVDISFSQKHQDVAVAIISILEYPSLKKVHEIFEVVKLDGPYVPGFLAFREAAHLVKLFNKLQITHPLFTPQVIMVDGNGILHQNACGLASHLGVLIDKPTIGIGKTIFYVDGLRKDIVLAQFASVKEEGGYAILKGDSGRIWGAAFKSKVDVIDPIIVSIGHKISLQSSLDLVSKCCKFRIPEPVRIADIRSREIVKGLSLFDALGAVTNELKFLSPQSKDCTKQASLKIEDEDFPPLI